MKLRLPFLVLEIAIFATSISAGNYTWQQEPELPTVPAYHACPPSGGLQPMLSPSNFVSDPVSARAYELARRIEATLYQLPCYCYCDRSMGHTSLLSCFNSDHGSQCDVCREELFFAYEAVHRGESVREIRNDIIQGKWRTVDLSNLVRWAGTASVNRSIAYFERSIGQDPRNVQAYVLIAFLEQSIKHWKKAEEFYREALRVQPNSAPAANNLASLILEHGGDKDFALSLAKLAQGEMPSIPNTADTLGWAYLEKNSYDAAIHWLQEAVEKDDKNPTYHYHLGLAYERVRDYSGARQQFERGLESSPQRELATKIHRALTQLPNEERR